MAIEQRKDIPSRSTLLVSILALCFVSKQGDAAEQIVAGKSFLGKPISCTIHGDGADTLMVIATIHGNECAGTPLVSEFSKWLGNNPAELQNRRVVIVPIANPDGFADGERYNNRGVDLNRNFPAGNWQQKGVNLHGLSPLSEPESRVLMQLLCRYFPDRIISIHQPVNCIDYDGPGKRLAQRMAAECDLPVKKLGGRPGSFGSFVGETLGKPIVTLELPKDAGMDADILWRNYGEALIAALRYKHSASEADATQPKSTKNDVDENTK